MHKNTTQDPKLSLFDAIELVNSDHWNQVVGTDNIYLSIPYLTALEKALHGEMEFRYTLFYNDQLQPVAASYIQILHLGDLSRYDEAICHLGDTIKNKLLSSIDARMLVCGNMFATGQNGFVYTSGIDAASAFKSLSRSMKRLTQEKEKNGHISFGLVKEYWPETSHESDHLHQSSFKDLMIDVNMVLKLRSNWQSFEDYLGDMTTKFRTKAKGVFKKSATLRAEDFDLAAIVQHKDRIEALYQAVLANADFKFGELNAQAFVNFKQHLEDKFILRGYFLEGKLIGFITLFLSDDSGDANYVGLDYEHNKEHAVYQRMLYDLVELSIGHQLKELKLGRTAEQMKSSLGAEPVNMKLYLRHRNSFSNKLIGPLVSSISPSKFELRPPFKKALS